MRGRNELKLVALRALDRSGPLNPAAFARIVEFKYESSAYHYLRRLAWFGLADRIESRGLLLYRISAKGRERLEWFEGRKRKHA